MFADAISRADFNLMTQIAHKFEKIKHMFFYISSLLYFKHLVCLKIPLLIVSSDLILVLTTKRFQPNDFGHEINAFNLN